MKIELRNFCIYFLTERQYNTIQQGSSESKQHASTVHGVVQSSRFSLYANSVIRVVFYKSYLTRPIISNDRPNGLVV